MPKLTAGREQSQRERIESETSVLMRSRGLGRVSIAEAMRAAGLTHGAFYCHYSGKEELEAAACARVFGRSLETWRAKFRESSGKTQPAEWLIEDYLSDESVADAGNGCPISSLASDVGRLEPDHPTKRTFDAGFSQLLALLAETFEGTAEDRFRRASMLLATLVGTLLLVRAISPNADAKRFRATVQGELLRQYRGQTACLTAS